MLNLFVPLYNLDNGVFVIGLFVLVCVLLIGVVLAMVFSGGDKGKS
ncbi:MAG: hypothetical protein H6603_11425 [Flavobacteriales bacterium]|nr:hypothetical protein [Flavobacteriales bacterium]